MFFCIVHLLLLSRLSLRTTSLLTKQRNKTFINHHNAHMRRPKPVNTSVPNNTNNNTTRQDVEHNSQEEPVSPTQSKQQLLQNRRLGIYFASLLGLACVVVFMMKGYYYFLFKKKRFHSRVTRHEEEEEDEFTIPDESGLAPWVLIPNRSRLVLTSGFGSKKKSNVSSYTILKQVVNPYVHSKTQKRTYGCLRAECRGLAMEDLSDREWRMLYKSGKISNTEANSPFKPNLIYKVTLLLTDGTDLTRLQKSNPTAYESVVNAQEGKTYVEAIENAEYIGGNKGQQLRAKIKYLEKRGIKQNATCTYNSLGIQPKQFRLYYKEECEEFLMKTSQRTTWLLKPETGSQGQGITYHKSSGSVVKKLPEFFPCKNNMTISPLNRFLVQEYIARPLLIKKSKFDVRVYLLVASTVPYLVFYREGYLRRSLHAYNPDSKDRAVHLTNTHYQSMKEGFKLSDHVWTFQAMQDYLIKNGQTGSHFVDSIMEPYIKRVSNFVFQTARGKLKRRKGSFNIFGLDFMVDDTFKVHFIEGNGYPGYTWSLNYDSRGLVTDVMDLVLELHETPQAFEKMKSGDDYGGFNLIFNELEETKFAHDACYDFHNNEAYFKSLRPAMRRFSKFTGYATSRLSDREDDDEEEEEKCKKSKICKQNKKLAQKEAKKQKNLVDRMFENLVDDLGEFGVYIGGAKDQQVESLTSFVSLFKQCASLNELQISPASYRLSNVVECNRALKYKTPSKWIAKPVDHTGNMGSGFVFIENQQEILKSVAAASCEALEGKSKYVVQRRIPNLLMLNDFTWSLKSYLLIASTEPFFVFHHAGFARSVRFAKNEDGEERVILGEEDVDLEEFQYLISVKHKLAGAKFVQTHVETFQKRVGELVYRAFRNKLGGGKIPNSHHLFEMDFMLDDGLKMWFLHSNYAPTFSTKVNINKLMQEDLRSLVLELNDSPTAFAGMRPGDAYGNFRLIASDFSDLILKPHRHADAARELFNPCEVFKRKWALNLNQAKLTNTLHDVELRHHHANERELKKFISAKWTSCRGKGRSTQTCSQALRGFIKTRYEIFLTKERKTMSPQEIDGWVDVKIADLMGLTTADQDAEGAVGAKKQEEEEEED